MWLENNVENYLVRKCKILGFHSVKSETITKGFVDRIIFAKEKGIFYVEIKNKTNYQQKKIQKHWMNIIKQSGGKYFIIDGIEEMKQFIKEELE